MDYEKKLYNEIGKKIKIARKNLGITQERLAELTNYSDSFIANIESNTYQSFSISALNNIAKALNKSMQELLPDENLLKSNNEQIKCEYCNYNVKIPKEISELLQAIENINKRKIILTCPKCQKKIM